MRKEIKKQALGKTDANSHEKKNTGRATTLNPHELHVVAALPGTRSGLDVAVHRAYMHRI